MKFLTYVGMLAFAFGVAREAVAQQAPARDDAETRAPAKKLARQDADTAENAREVRATTGTLMVAFPYALGVFISAGDKFDNQKGWLLAPVAGPWITLLARKEYDCPTDGCQGSHDLAVGIALISDGLVQATGAILILTAIPPANSGATVRPVSVAPYVRSNAAGLTVVGTF
jgi:hypothetical protein